MSKAHKIYDWEEWKEFCEEWNENPHEIADLSVGYPGHPDTKYDYEYMGDTPKREGEDA